MRISLSANLQRVRVPVGPVVTDRAGGACGCNSGRVTVLGLGGEGRNHFLVVRFDEVT